MRERVWNRWRRALAMLIALLLAIEALPLQTLAAPSRGGYIPLIVSEDEDEEEDVESSDELENDAENTTKEAYSDNADSSDDEKK